MTCRAVSGPAAMTYKAVMSRTDRFPGYVRAFVTGGMTLRWLLLSAVLVVSACGGGPGPSDRAPADDTLPTGDNGGTRKIGNPYKVAGVWYHPEEDPTYDRTGYASWYGKQFHGRKTANGEVFNMNALTAAHKTLPLPSFVKVTNLENGRSILLRVNDRGPFVKNRIIDVSRRGAQLLGFEKQGVTKVRVQVVDENGRAPKRRRVAKADSPVAGGDAVHFVQVGAFGERDNARAQVRKLRDAGVRADVEDVRADGRQLWRVRIGPFRERNEAERALDRVMAGGFYEARIFSEPK